MDVGPCIDGLALLTPRAEQRFQREVERCGGYMVDVDVVALCSAAASFQADCDAILNAVAARGRPWPQRVAAAPAAYTRLTAASRRAA